MLFLISYIISDLWNSSIKWKHSSSTNVREIIFLLNVRKKMVKKYKIEFLRINLLSMAKRTKTRQRRKLYCIVFIRRERDAQNKMMKSMSLTSAEAAIPREPPSRIGGLSDERFATAGIPVHRQDLECWNRTLSSTIVYNRQDSIHTKVARPSWDSFSTIRPGRWSH